MAALLGPFDGAPLLEWLELANRHLGAALDGPEAGRDPPAVELVRVGPDGVEVRLVGPADWAPPGWELGPGGRAWLLPAGVDRRGLSEARGHPPWLPCLVPAGDNEDGSWLIPIEPGACLPVIGAEADALVETMRRAAAGWSWAEQVVVTDDRALAEREAELIGQPGPGDERLRVLFVVTPPPSTSGPVAAAGSSPHVRCRPPTSRWPSTLGGPRSTRSASSSGPTCSTRPAWPVSTS